jgi:outer membrane immunogenic protein
MRKLLVMASVAVVFAGSAYAADLPVAYKVPPVPVFSWTGWYFGVNGGGGWGTTDHTASITVGGMPAPLTTGDFNVSGTLVGGTAGYNFQMGQWVWGAETDLNWANISGTFNGVIAGPGIPFSLSSKLNWLDTTRVRAGWTFDHTLLYATAGAAFGGLTTTAGTVIPGFVVGSAAETQTRFGWTAGVGLEHAFTPSISAKIEYLHVDLGTQTQLLIDNVKFTSEIVRGGLNLKF